MAAAAGVLLLAGAWYWHGERTRRGKEAQGPKTVAIVPFENLSGEAALDWFGAAIPPLMARQLEAVEDGRVLTVASSAEAAGRGATHVLSGYFDGAGGVRYSIESVARRQTIAEGRLLWERDGKQALPPRLAVAARDALGLKGELAPFEIRTERALRAWAEGRFEEAVGSDPGCGWCWLAWAEETARTKGPGEAAGIVARSRTHFERLPALTQARLELLEATLKRDEGLRRKALEQLVQMGRNEPEILLAMAEAYTRERAFVRAAELLRNAIKGGRRQPELWNTLGYAYAWMGDFAQARQALQQYESLAPGSANPLDSKGEIELMAGSFQAAVKAFRASFGKDGGFNHGAAMEKAALASWLQGDMAAASRTAEEYLEARRRAGDAFAPYHEARWRLLLGQTREARSQFEAVAKSPGAPAALAAIRLSLWSALEGDGGSSGRWAEAALARLSAQGGGPLRGIAKLLAGTGAAGAQAEDEPLLRRTEALRLAARQGPEAGAGGWDRARARSAGGSDSVETEMLAASLAAARRTGDAAKLLGKTWPLLSQTDLALFDFVVLPAAVYSRAEIARHEKRDGDAVKLYDLYLRSMGQRRDQAPQVERARAFARL
jgi:Flp pilus assembly protein TadD